MPSKSREARIQQRDYWQEKLNRRISELKEKSPESDEVKKDVLVREFRAKLRETEKRLKAIGGLEKKKEEMDAAKARKLETPKEKKSRKKEKEETQAESKRQQKKKKKKEGKAEGGGE